MRKSNLGNISRILLFAGLIFMVSCAPAPDTEVLENVPEVPEAPAEDEEMEQLPEIVVPVGDAFTFVLSVHRVGHGTDQGVNMMIEERAEVEVMGEGDLLIGRGTGPAHFIPAIGHPCNMECFYEIEYEIKGYFKPQPDCDLFLVVYPSVHPGECTTECGPLEVIPYAGGIYDALIDEVTFKGHKIGLEGVTKNREVLTKELGNAQWTNSFEINYFEGDPSSMGCIFDF